MPSSWCPFLLTPSNDKRETDGPVNLIPIMHSPLESQKQEVNNFEFSQQQQPQQQATWRPVGPPLQRFHSGVHQTTYIHSLNINFNQPGDYNISINLSGEVVMAPEAAAQAQAIMAKPTKKPVTGVSPLQRTPADSGRSSPWSTAKVQEAPVIPATEEDGLFETAIANPFGTSRGGSDAGTFFGYGGFK